MIVQFLSQLLSQKTTHKPCELKTHNCIVKYHHKSGLLFQLSTNTRIHVLHLR